MKIREIKPKDIPFILEWMSDETITSGLFIDYSSKDIKDIEKFIETMANDRFEKHYAVVNDEDEYMGTIMLRNIDMEEGVAELVIVVRRCAMSKGYALYGMLNALDIAFERMGLSSVYWCVPETNFGAIRFFQKHGFRTLDEDVPLNIVKTYEEAKNPVWFAVLRGDDYRNNALSRGMVAGNRVINISTVPTIEAGELSFFETYKDISFEIKRIYYISKVPEGKRRGYHAHKQLKQLLFCPYGEIQLVLDDGFDREEITLNDPSIGIIIEKPVWREMLWLKKDSILCVAASDYYNADDYIRNYTEFQNYLRSKG